MSGFTPIAAPSAKGVLLTAADVQAGPPVDPLKRLFGYDPSEWEVFIHEWAFGYLKTVYLDVQRFSGANDRGIDIAGFTDKQALLGVWDCYQCKHYKDPLAPASAFLEIGKILWHSFNKEYVPPRAYWFVAPREVGTTLRFYLNNVVKLKVALFEAWEKSCEKKITSTQDVKLEGAFKAYCEAFDYTIFKPKTLLDVIEQHKKTQYYLGRFGGGLPQRPQADTPPDEIAAEESRYVEQLLAAYAEHTAEDIPDVAGLKKWTKLDGHFRRQREAFYHAESLRVFVRDKVEPGTFESLQNQIFKGVIDTHDEDYDDGFERVKAVAKAAQDLSLQAHPLAPSTMLEDRHGVCHQLANEDRLKWTK